MIVDSGDSKSAKNRDRPRASSSRFLTRVGKAAAMAALLSFMACARTPGGASDAQASVILIVVDTLRADHLSLGGYARPTSPRLEEYARRGVYFERFYSHASWTRPSIATLLTSLHSRSHGVVDTGRGLARDLTTMPEILKDAGYGTYAFVASPQIHPELGFAQGFDEFFPLFRAAPGGVDVLPQDLAASVPDAEVLAKVLAELSRMEETPYFAYVHLLDPHGPYEPAAADREAFTDPDYSGRISGRIEDFAKVSRLAAKPAELAQFIGLYDGEVRGTDRALGEFFDALDRAGRLANTHVLVTADHGEEFLEHGGTGHGRKLFEESIHIPLLWLGPELPRGRRVLEVGGLVDILPTLLDVLGIPSSGLDLDGESLRSLWTTDSPPGTRAVLLEEFTGTSERVYGRDMPFVGRGLIQGRQKLLTGPVRLDQRRVAELTFYDLEEDPGEHSPRALGLHAATWSESEAALVARYVRADRAALGRMPNLGPPIDALPEEDLQRLRSLGYLD